VRPGRGSYNLAAFFATGGAEIKGHGPLSDVKDDAR